MIENKFYCNNCGEEMNEDCDLCEDCSFDDDVEEDEE
jgi:hypothetical protein